MRLDDATLNLRLECEADGEFLARLYRSTRDDLLLSDLPQAMLDGLINMQFRAQQTGYQSQFPDARYQILEKAGEPIGALLVYHGEKAIRLAYIAILPHKRRHGHGRRLIAALQAEAARANKVLTLSVFANNAGARRLYLACGFQPGARDGVNVEMTWPCPISRT